MLRKDLTAERLREVLNYNPDTGVFSWRIVPHNRFRVGDIAGTKHAQGYRIIAVSRVYFMEHRLVWLWVHGVWPKEGIDHINGVRDDNRIANLREATKAENSQNRKAKTGGGEFGLGTTYNKSAKKWQATIGIGRRREHLGSFATQEEAHAAYAAAKLVTHTFSPVAYSQQ